MHFSDKAVSVEVGYRSWWSWCVDSVGAVSFDGWQALSSMNLPSCLYSSAMF